MDRIRELLASIYGAERGAEAFRRIRPRIESVPVRPASGEGFFTERDSVLITYGDSLLADQEAPLQTFRRFARQRLRGLFSTVHFLPFYPYSSDDGFSVMDFFAVNPELGEWQDIAAIGADFHLMFDYVLNHVSAKSAWFRNYLKGKLGFEDLAIEVDPVADLSGVTRPRSLPLLTEFEKADGETVRVWTTFSADQIDLNFQSLDVLEKMIRVLLHYVERGARLLRLDAIAYLWKEVGTSCIHLPQTHAMVKLFRAILDRVAPDVIIITETNVPHAENISYFGTGRDEAQMVYNFTLPPLLLHALAREDATILSRWARGLQLESDRTTFFNFTASHDGIGVRPLEGILPAEEIDALAAIARQNGGRVSTKRNPDGSDSPYELNITYVDALRRGTADDPQHAARFLASQAIQYALPGVPATYIHSLLGSRNWLEGVERTGRARTINREKLHLDTVQRELADPDSFRSRIFFPYARLISIRRNQPAFHPNAAFEILDLDPRVFAIRRFCPEQEILAVTNISSRPVTLSLSNFWPDKPPTDLLSEAACRCRPMALAPYQTRWLTATPGPK